MKLYSAALALCLTLVSLLAGCGGQLPATPTPTSGPNLEGLVITLERTACFGACPIYKLTVRGDGSVVYEGERFVKVTGRQTAQISKEKVQELVAEFEKADYFSLKDEYTDYRVTDLPSALTSITLDGKNKSVNHYQGDTSAPESLTNLENKINEIADSDQWIK